MVQRILHIVGKMDRAGAETMLMNLYRNIDRTCFQFDFVVFSNYKGDYDDEITELGGRVIPIIASNPIKRMKALKEFLQRHREYKIVHSHTLLSSGLHLKVAAQSGIKHRIVHAHSTTDNARTLLSKIYQTVSKNLIKKYATQKIACGKAAAEFLFETQKNVLILPNSLDIAGWMKMGIEEKDYIKTQFHFDGLKIIQVGRLQPVKNHTFTLKLAEYMKNQGVDFRLFVVGQGVLEESLKQEVEHKNLEDVVAFLGLRTDVPQLMAGADVMLMPSLYEGFPVVLVESQAVGLRSVIADTISSEVDLGVQLVDFVGLNTSLSEWMEQITKKNTETLSLEKRIACLSEQGFDIKNSVSKLECLYSSIANV